MKTQCPGCGIGDELIVTTTKKRSSKTQYYSIKFSPNTEVTKVVTASACVPILFRPVMIDGEEHNDGGVLSNFPTEVFSDDHSTLLESEYGNNLKTLAVQFDTGTERNTIDRVMEEVYREGFILNWIYQQITGVNDPASGWEQDRLKLRKYAAQSVVVDVNNVSTANFSINEETRQKMIDNGYFAMNNYLNSRYSRKDQGPSTNKELMYSTFSSLGDLLAYCCYRGDLNWFNTVNDLIVHSALPNRISLMKQSLQLRKLYFNKPPAESSEENSAAAHSPAFFGHTAQQDGNEKVSKDNPLALLSLYPIFMKLDMKLVTHSNDKKILERAVHVLRINAPFTCLERFDKLKGDHHIVLHLIIELVKELKNNPSESTYTALAQVEKLLSKNLDFFAPEFFGKWAVDDKQRSRMLNILSAGHVQISAHFCNLIKRGEDASQLTVNGETYHDDFNNGSDEGDRFVAGA